MTTKNSIISALVGVICALFLFIPTTILGTSEMFKGDNGSCCYSEKKRYCPLIFGITANSDVRLSVIAKNDNNIVTGVRFFRLKNILIINILRSNVTNARDIRTSTFHWLGTKYDTVCF
jgi:hypothetical protein